MMTERLHDESHQSTAIDSSHDDDTNRKVIRDQPKQKHIVALGSSFASGASIPPLVHKEANRSSKNYPNLISHALQARLTDLSAAGATLLHVLDQPQPLPTTSLPPQIPQISPDADIVTLTAGGNDIAYSARMILDAAEASSRGAGGNGEDVSWLVDFLRPHVDAGIDAVALAGRLSRVLDGIRARAPRASVYLVEYLTVFGDDACAGQGAVPFAEDRLRAHRDAARALSAAYEDAARERAWVKVVRVAERSLKHGVDAEEPWVTGWEPGLMLSGFTPYHPNARGHEAVAEFLLKQVAEDE